MKWINHTIMAGSIACMIGLSPAEVVLCAAGANLPDQMERVGKIRVIKHRTLTHEVLLWLLPMLAFAFLPSFAGGVPRLLSIGGGDGIQKLLSIRVAVLFLPGLLHLAGDVLTPRGIQMGGRKISLYLFQTGHLLEYVVAALFLFLAVFFKVHIKSLPF